MPIQEYLLTYCYMEIRNGDKALVLCGDNSKYMNHSNMPNLIEVNHDNTSINVAIVDIKAGEELTCNYFDFDLDAHRKLDMYD